MDSKKEQALSPLGKIERREIVEEMKASYIDYAMSVIVARALPVVINLLKTLPLIIRYSEARMSRAGGIMLQDIERETVDFVDNYDGNRKEPSVLPSPLPQLLLNGTLGIAVGMMTNIPPHNMGED